MGTSRWTRSVPTNSENREIDVVLNTPYGKQQRHDDSSIRSSAVIAGIPCITTRAGISALVSALSALQRGDFTVKSLQEHHKATQLAQR